jgi:hypothetical protein
MQLRCEWREELRVDNFNMQRASIVRDRGPRLLEIEVVNP